MSEELVAESGLFPERIGDRLRAARVKAGMDLQDVATRTRVPLRHLTAIENGEFASLPSPTYTLGFAKAYAKAVGEDDSAIVEALRYELGKQPPVERYEPHFVDEEPTGPSFPMRMVWTTLAILALLGIGYGVWRANMTPAADDLFAASEATPPDAAAIVAQGTNNVASTAPGAEKPVGGEVILTAVQPVWLRIYDAADKVLFEKEMVTGERFVVPADANKPMIRTGRPDMLKVTVGGVEVPALGPAERTIRDVEISAAALSARPAPPVTPTGSSVSAATQEP
jgi:cytoskeleton protein RodZ